MAEISSAHGAQGRPGAGKSKKLSTRIDLTPMVDLGFLLIAFFMITTTLAMPKTMEINMPWKDGDDTPESAWRSSLSLTLLPANGHSVYYYSGVDNGANYNAAYFTPQHGIRAVINAKKHTVDSLKRAGIIKPSLQVSILIKPDTGSTYSDLVNVLDEMTINGVAV